MKLPTSGIFKTVHMASRNQIAGILPDYLQEKTDIIAMTKTYKIKVYLYSHDHAARVQAAF